MDLFLQVNQDSLQCSKPKILVLNTGGTFASHYSNPELLNGVHFIKNACFEQLKQHFEAKENYLENSFYRFWIYEIEPMVESEEMEMKDWCHLCTLIKKAYSVFDSFVILHGTNTMDFTASALSFMIKNLTKPIIVTGSIIPLSIEGSDALSNLEGALTLSTKSIPEVCIYFDGVLMRANRTIKVSNKLHHPFKSPKCRPFAFRRSDGTFDFHLEHLLRHEEHLPTLFKNDALNSKIGILHLFPSIPSSQIKAQIEDPELEGLIIVGYGGGYMMTQRKDFLDLLESKAKNLLMVLISQSFPEEPVRKEMAEVFHNCGILSGADLTLPSAVAKMALILDEKTWNFEEKKRQMILNWEGEIS